MGRAGNRFAAVMTTVAFVASAGFALAAPVGAATKGTDAVTASPAPGSQLAPNTHYYELHPHPGDSITQTVHLVNNNKHAIDVRIAGLDGYTSDATGAAYTTPAETAKGTGTWVVVSTPELTLQAGESRDVPFTVHVPVNAKPGQYLAAVGMWVPLASSTTTVPGGQHAGFAVTLQGERVIAVEMVIPGAASPSLAVSGVQPVAAPDGLRLQVAMANNGNAFTKGSGVVTVADTKLNYPFTIDTFVSHTAITYRIPWTRTVVPGSHRVSVKLTYAGHRVTTWNGTVVIGGALQRQLQQGLHDNTVGAAAPAHQSSPLPLILGAIAVLLCASGAIWFRRRGQRVPLPAG
jgi:hypothetical protein